MFIIFKQLRWEIFIYQVSICIDKHEDEQIEKAIQDIKQNTKYIPISSKEEIEVYKMVSKKSLNTQKW